MIFTVDDRFPRAGFDVYNFLDISFSIAENIIGCLIIIILYQLISLLNDFKFAFFLLCLLSNFRLVRFLEVKNDFLTIKCIVWGFLGSNLFMCKAFFLGSSGAFKKTSD